MLVIRLSRVGRKNDPSFRIVLQEKHRTPTGKAIEYLGSYNAKLKQKSLKADRIKYWISRGAQVSDTVHNLLVDEKIIDASKRKASTTKKKNNTEKSSTEIGDKTNKENQETKIEEKDAVIQKIEETKDSNTIRIDEKNQKETKIKDLKEGKQNIDSEAEETNSSKKEEETKK